MIVFCVENIFFLNLMSEQAKKYYSFFVVFVMEKDMMATRAENYMLAQAIFIIINSDKFHCLDCIQPQEKWSLKKKVQTKVIKRRFRHFSLLELFSYSFLNFLLGERRGNVFIEKNI